MPERELLATRGKPQLRSTLPIKSPPAFADRRKLRGFSFALEEQVAARLAN